MSVPLISIVDDDESVRTAIANLIRSLGYSVETFASAEAYLRFGRIQDTACVITDLHMPGLDGAGLQGQLAANGHRTPIIFVTGYPDEQTRSRVLAAGAIGFFRKPFAEQSLITCLDKALKA